MTVYLIRHAHAVDGEDDAARELSGKGRGQVERLAKFLRENGAFHAEEIWHSPLLRARETAGLLAHGLRSKAPLRETAGLLPNDAPAEIGARLNALKKSVALVGHEPQMSALGTLLVEGRPWPAAFAMRKCAVLALDSAGEGGLVRRSPKGEGAWVVRWHLAPELLDG